MMCRFGANARRIVEIGERRRDAPAIDVVAGEGKAARARLGVGVVVIRDAGPCRRVPKGQRETAPVLGKGPADREGSVTAMEGAVEIHVPLEPAKIGQTIAPAPAGRAEALPFVVVGRDAAQGDLPVDAGASAHHPCLLVANRLHLAAISSVERLPIGVAMDGQVRPVPRFRGSSRAGNLPRRSIPASARRRVRTGFEEADSHRRTRGQAVGQDASRRAATDDHVVERRGLVQGVTLLRGRNSDYILAINFTTLTFGRTLA